MPSRNHRHVLPAVGIEIPIQCRWGKASRDIVCVKLPSPLLKPLPQRPPWWLETGTIITGEIHLAIPFEVRCHNLLRRVHAADGSHVELDPRYSPGL